MKNRILYGLTLVIVTILLWTGCGILGLDESGVLVLSLSPNLTTKTIEPDLDMSVSYYNISGSGPGGKTFEQTEVTGTTVVQASLIPGEWEITVEAFNADPVKIGQGVATITIVSGEVLSTTITVQPLAGTGSLEIGVTWPAGILINPYVTGTLVPSGVTYDPALHNISFDGGDVSSFYTNEALEAGYYTLSIALYHNGGARVWGTVEAVRIVFGEISSKTYDLVEDLNLGGLSLGIVPELDNPIEVILDVADGTEVPAGESLTVTASTGDVAVESFTWYVSGELVQSGAGGTSDVLVLDTLSGGYYTLNVLVVSGDVLSSASLQFRVLPPGDPDPPVDMVYIGAPDENGSPSYFQRTFLVMLNSVRMAPYEYTQIYPMHNPATLLPENFPPVHALQWKATMGDGATAHSVDMAVNIGALQHDSSDGTPWIVRIRTYTPEVKVPAEVIAYNGSVGPRRVLNMWLDDVGLPDGEAPNRQILASASYSWIGVGYAEGLNGNYPVVYYTADFGAGYSPEIVQHISGSHDMVDGNTEFLLSYYEPSGAPPTSVTLVVDGIEIAMPLILGQPGAGTYSYSEPTLPQTSQYYFVVDDGLGTVWRYPGPGVFQVDGAGIGAEDYVVP